MKSFQLKSLLLLTTLIISLPSFGQGLKAFKLKSGLSVYIWEDESKSDVFGLVGVRAGSINDPEEDVYKRQVEADVRYHAPSEPGRHLHGHRSAQCKPLVH